MRRSEGAQKPSGTTTCAGWFAASAGVAATWCKLVPHLDCDVSGSPGTGCRSHLPTYNSFGKKTPGGAGTHFRYVVLMEAAGIKPSMIKASQNASGMDTFMLQCHVGDVAVHLSRRFRPREDACDAVVAQQRELEGRGDERHIEALAHGLDQKVSHWKDPKRNVYMNFVTAIG